MLLIASCSNLPEWEVDDHVFHRALEARGVAYEVVPWDGAAAWRDATACLIRTTWDYQERRDQFLGWVENVSATTTLWNPATVVRWNTHKRYLRDLAEAGVPTLPTVWIPRGGAIDLAAVMAERGWSRGMLKPAIGATARGTHPFTTDAPGLAAATAHLEPWLETDDFMLQPYCASVETEGETSLIMVDGAITHAVRKIPVAGDYRVQDDFGARDEAVEIDDELRAIATQAFGVVQEPLLCGRADFLRGPDGAPCITELELVEPSLFFRHGTHAADALADAVVRRLNGQNGRA